MNRLQELLEKLKIAPGAKLYLHSSFNFLRHLDMSPAQIVTTLLDYLGSEGTLASPSFWWNVDQGHRLWHNLERTFREAPLFDYDHAPCNVGIIPETLRQQPGSLRAITYWYPVVGHGPLAAELCRSAIQAQNDHDPNDDGPFARLLRMDFTILGLGVSPNTTSLSFLADSALGSLHPQPFLTEDLRVGRIRVGGKILEQRSRWLLPEAVKGVRPREVMDRSHALGGDYQEAKVGESIHFCYPARSYHAHALQIGRECLQLGQPMPWLPGLPVVTR